MPPTTARLKKIGALVARKANKGQVSAACATQMGTAVEELRALLSALPAS